MTPPRKLPTETGSRKGGRVPRLPRVAHVVEANERLLLSALRAWTDAETSAQKADEVTRSAHRNEKAAVQAREALARMNAELEARVSERTRELVQARDEALAATKSKERFLSNMSHEIRTPMFGMLGAMELLSHTGMTPDQAEYLRVASASGEALLAIINEVLDFAKIGAGQMRLVHEPIDIVAIAQSVAELFSAAAQTRSIDLALEADAALAPRRMGDSLHLRQVLMNLIGNAIKFAPHGRVVVRVQPVGAQASDRVHFEVSDSGIGIDESQQARIFEPFAQSDHPGQKPQGGTGLGLTISRDLVQAMGGRLEVSSALGRGATFGFDLTLPRAPEPPAELLRTAPAASVFGASARRVLLVEDNPVNQVICQSMLEAMGLDVVLAEDGALALEQLAEGSFGAVLMDCQMPVMDGYEATRRLREVERLNGRARTPVIALTANAFSDDVQRCMAAGMDAHLSKPFKVQALQALLVRWIPVVAH